MTFRKKTEFKIKAAFFGFFQAFFRKGNPEKIPLDGKDIKKAIILRPDRIGDTVCSFPLIDHLKRNFPDMKISIFASPKNYGLIREDPRFEEIYIYRRNIIRDIATVRRIRKKNYDLLIDMMGDDSVTTLVLSQLCVSGKPRIGVNKRNYGKYYDFTYAQPENCEDHTIDINLRLLKAFGLNPEAVDPFAPPYVSEESEKRAGRFLEKIAGGNHQDLKIGFNLSSRGANRDWGLEKSGELAVRIIENYPSARIILITVPSEREKGDKLEGRLNGLVSQIFPGANLTEVSSLIKRLDLLISPDTSLVHIARSFRIPVIGLYPEYRKVYRQWLPYRQPKGLVLSYGGDNIFNITVDEVFDTFRKMVEEKSPASERLRG